MNIKISTVEDVKRFVSIAQKQDCDIDIQSGTRYIVDAKSIMGLFSLNLAKEVVLVVHESNPFKKRSVEDAFAEFAV